MEYVLADGDDRIVHSISFYSQRRGSDQHVEVAFEKEGGEEERERQKYLLGLTNGKPQGKTSASLRPDNKPQAAALAFDSACHNSDNLAVRSLETSLQCALYKHQMWRNTSGGGVGG